MSVFGRSCISILVLAAACAPFVGWGALRALNIQIDDSTKWVPATSPIRQDYEYFTTHFENGDALIVSWLGCTIDDPRLDRVAAALRDSTRFHDAAGAPYFERVATGADSFRRLCEPPVELAAAEAAQRLQGSVLGPDGKTTAVFVTFSKAGVADRMAAVRATRDTVIRVAAIEPDALRLGGNIIDAFDIQEATNESMNVFGPLSAAVIWFSCWYCLKSWRVALIVFALSFYCEAAALALVHYCGNHMSPLMIVMPPLILVLGVSGGIHLVNYYYDALRTGNERTAPRRAFLQGWLPCLLSAGTTAIGLGSLWVSELVPIRDFGLFSAVGVMLTLAILFLLVPGAFELWPVRREQISSSNSAGDNSHDSAAPRSTPWLRAIARGLARHHAAVTISSLAIMIFAGWGVQYVRTSISIHSLFPEGSRFLRDYRWLESNLGPLVPIEVLVEFREDCQLDMYERLQIIKTIQRDLQTMDGVGGTMSAATFLPDLTLGRGLAAFFSKKIVSRKLADSRARLFQSGFLREANGVQQWRVTARVSSLAERDYGDFLLAAQKRIEPVVTSHASYGITGISFSVTGVMPVVHAVQRHLMNDLFSSFLSACAIITVVMMLNERGIGAGLVAMIPNVFPIALLIGALGWGSVPMDIGSVMTASVALGMAIDGTLHYLTFYRRALAHGETSAQAVETAFAHCAPAMTESSVVCGLGLLMFAFGSFLPTQRFAWMMVALIAAAWVGDLIVLPAMLVGPLGWFFKPSRPTTAQR